MTRAGRKPDPEPEPEYIPTAEEAAELEAALEEAERGGGIPLDQFLRDLRERERHR